MKALYNAAMLPLYLAWRVTSRVLYIVSGWWLWKRVLGVKTGEADVVSRGLHR